MKSFFIKLFLIDQGVQVDITQGVRFTDTEYSNKSQFVSTTKYFVFNENVYMYFKCSICIRTPTECIKKRKKNQLIDRSYGFCVRYFIVCGKIDSVLFFEDYMRNDGGFLRIVWPSVYFKTVELYSIVIYNY